MSCTCSCLRARRVSAAVALLATSVMESFDSDTCTTLPLVHHPDAECKQPCLIIAQTSSETNHIMHCTSALNRAPAKELKSLASTAATTRCLGQVSPTWVAALAQECYLCVSRLARGHGEGGGRRALMQLREPQAMLPPLPHESVLARDYEGPYLEAHFALCYGCLARLLMCSHHLHGTLTRSHFPWGSIITS